MTCQRSRGASGGIHAQTAGRRAHPALRPLGSQVPFGRRARRGGKFYCMTGLSEALARLQPSVRFQRSLTPPGAAVPHCDLPHPGPGQRPACTWLWAAAPLSPGIRSSASRPSWTPGSWPSTEPGSGAQTHRAGFRRLADSAGSGRRQGRKNGNHFPLPVSDSCLSPSI